MPQRASTFSLKYSSFPPFESSKSLDWTCGHLQQQCRDKKALAKKVEELAQQLKAAEAGHTAASQALQADQQRHLVSFTEAHNQQLTALQDQLQQAAASKA